MKPLELFNTVIESSKIAHRNVSGIYMIYNLLTGKAYIGQSVHPRGRWTSHKSDLERNKHWNKNLQSDFDKYGKWSFHYLLLENCPPNILVDREKYYCEKIDLDYLYNVSSPSTKGPNKGTRLSAEHRKNLSIAAKNRVKKMKEIYGENYMQRTINGETGMCFPEKLSFDKTSEEVLDNLWKGKDEANKKKREEAENIRKNFN